jgi:predicted small secreted protein
VRRILVAAYTVSALALAACGTDEGAGQPAAAGGADTTAATASACTEAMALSKTGATAFEEGIDNLLEVALEGDDVKADAAEKEFRATLAAWADRLAELSGEPVAEDVKAALTETAATVKKIADPEDNTPINAATQQLAGISDKIGAACA